MRYHPTWPYPPRPASPPSWSAACRGWRACLKDCFRACERTSPLFCMASATKYPAEAPPQFRKIGGQLVSPEGETKLRGHRPENRCRPDGASVNGVVGEQAAKPSSFVSSFACLRLSVFGPDRWPHDKPFSAMHRKRDASAGRKCRFPVPEKNNAPDRERRSSRACAHALFNVYPALCGGRIFAALPRDRPLDLQPYISSSAQQVVVVFEVSPTLPDCSR